MPRIRTHYDNLGVSRNAPTEVIRAAYKALSQKYHPDKNPGNAEAARIMSIINASYEALIDPARRRQHDLWISKMEGVATQGTSDVRQQSPSSMAKALSAKLLLPSFNLIKPFVIWAFSYAIGVGAFFGVIC
jgi:DnaJ-class molecular chaperone